MPPLYNFGLSQEDERTEAQALRLDERSRVLSVASAGDMPLSLLALGAAHVRAVDVDPRQLHLVRLKLAAVATLDRETAIRFLGFLPCPAAARRGWLGAVLEALPPDARAFWRQHGDALAAGAIWAGRYERYVTTFVRALRPLLGRRFAGLFDCADLSQQRDYFDRQLDRRRLRALFAVAFHPRLYARRGMDPRGLSQRDASKSLADQFFGRFRDVCTRTPARDNHLLQLHLIGRVVSTDAVPAYLSRDGFPRLRERADRLELVHADLAEALRAMAAGAFDAAHLSNVPDWLDQPAFEEVLGLVAARADRSGASAGPGRPARVVWRFLHVDRAVPDDLAASVRVDRGLGDALRQDDRFPFYGVVPATIGAEPGAAP